MKRLSVEMEINGKSTHIGEICGNHSEDACFTYAEEYLCDSSNRAISLSLPLTERTFDSRRTRNFFEGLLPEGFTRKCVAQNLKSDTNDYLPILAGLGSECLGAIKILDEDSPQIKSEYRELTISEVHALAKEGATESAQLVTKAHLSLTGASGKVGLYFDFGKKQWYLPIGEAPSTHIVKQSHVRLKKIVANEQFCLMTAKKLGIDIPESFIINLGNYEEENVLFVTRRYDRKIDKNCRKIEEMTIPYRLHQEDFAQALGISSFDKYEKNNAGYLKKMFQIIRNHSADPMTDQMKLWDICIFNYLIGNTDNHIKNLSLLYSENMKSIRLAPAYDIVSTMIYENSTDQMAIGIDGKYGISDITKESFASEAEAVGLGRKIAMQRFDKMVSKFEKAMKEAENELLEEGFGEIKLIKEQIIKKGGIHALL